MKNKLFIVIAVLIVAVTLFSGCGRLFGGGSGAKDKEFTKAGMTITLTEDFIEKELVSQTAYYESTTIIVTVLKEDFTSFQTAGHSTDMSLKDYAELVVSANSITATVESKDSLTCFKYEKQISGKDYSYFATVFRGSDAYWLVQFACETKNYETNLENFVKWGKTVKV